ncbi:MAG: thioesterase family protein [Pseudomonadota bacterium]
MTEQAIPNDPMTAEFDPIDPASYPLWSAETVRYSDQDPLGHVNNNAYGIYFETARLDFFQAADLRHGTMADAAGVVRRLDMEFLRELTWPSDLRIGTRLVGLGKSSFSYRQGLFVGDVCHALAFTVSVGFDLKTRSKVVLTDAHRTGLRRAGLPQG